MVNGSVTSSASVLDVAARTLRHGGLVAHATEGVWGIACDPFAEAAVQRVRELKGRDADKGFILLADSIDRLEPLLAPLAAAMRRRIAASWPGPVTWIVPCGQSLPRWVVSADGAHGTVALRVPDHPQVADLCARADRLLLSTSANRSGCPPARNEAQVRAYFPVGLDCIVAGQVGSLGKPTRLIDARDGEVLRP